MGKILEKIFIKDDIQMVDKHMKRFLIALVIVERCIQIAMGYTVYLPEWLK